MVLKYNIRTRFLADQGAIKNVLTVENDVVPFDRADVLGAGLRQCLPLVTAPARPVRVVCLACQLASRRKEYVWVSIITRGLFDRPKTGRLTYGSGLSSSR